MVWAFWIAAAFVGYVLVGYPALLLLVSHFRQQKHERKAIRPLVSIIITVYNQSDILTEKIENTLRLKYPKDKIEIVIGSDCSNDATAEIIKSYFGRGVKFVESTQRVGKHYMQMMARDASCGEILVFTDVGIHLEPDVLETIVSNFASPTVGAVSSEDQIQHAKEGWMGERLYVYGEMGLRRLESSVNSLVSLSGSLFAVRRDLCRVWHPDQSSDFFVALHTVAAGMRAVVDPEVRASFGVVRSERAELRRKVRTIVHGMVVLFSHKDLLNPLRYGMFSWQLLSHKLFRWLLPIGMLAIMVANLFLWKKGLFFQACLIIQLGVYATGLLSFVGGRIADLKPVLWAGVLVLGNVATLLAWVQFCFGEKYVTWEPSRRT
jgi:cellulose synthase/poly-beta-1,6-N-acetylglucosamine synthase-like glycosyltransferase